MTASKDEPVRLSVWVILLQIFTITAVILIGIVGGKYSTGGYQWSGVHIFNFHPLLMTVGMIYLFGDAILVYRIFPNTKKIYVKILHSMLQALVILISGFGLHATFKPNEDENYPSFRTLHSWLGLFVVFCFCIQWLAGLVMFLLPICSNTVKANYKFPHVFWGSAIYGLAGTTCITGAYGQVLLDDMDSYFSPDVKGWLTNFYVVMVVFGVLTALYILSKSSYRRVEPENSETQAINEGHTMEGGTYQ